MPCFEEVAVAWAVATVTARVGRSCLDLQTCCCSVAITVGVAATLAVVDSCSGHRTCCFVAVVAVALAVAVVIEAVA